MCKTNATYRERFTRPLKARLAPLISSKDRAVMLLYHVPVSFAYALVLLLVARSVVNLAHHQGDHERVNAGNGAACGVSGDGDGRL